MADAVRVYIGPSDPDVGYISGVPMHDLDQAAWDALPADKRQAAEESGLYVPPDSTEARRARRMARADAADVQPAEASDTDGKAAKGRGGK